MSATAPEAGSGFPADRSGVAILGAGTIAQSAHLPAYAQHGVGVTGVWSRSPATTRGCSSTTMCDTPARSSASVIVVPTRPYPTRIT